MSATYVRNMSVAPRTTITHRGVGIGMRLVVALPESEEDLTPEGILDRLRSNTQGLQGAAAERELRRLIDVTIGRLPLPAAAPVLQSLDVPENRAQRCSSLIDIVSILAKSSDRVFLREKSAILSGIRPGRRIILVLPVHNDWSG
jgi:hypothetical protein